MVRLALTEGFLIAVLAGVAALVVAQWSQVLVGSFAIPIEQPQHIDLTPDGTIVGFLLVLVLIAGVLPGLWPAISAARVDLARVLGSQGGSVTSAKPSRVPRRPVGAQVAGSTAFLALAILLAQTYGRLSLADLGFDKDHLVIADFEPASHGYDFDRTERYLDALVARMRALPGVTTAAVADRVPFFIGFEQLTVVSSGGARCEPDACPKFATMAVGPGYFRTMGIAMIAGREFEPGGAPNEVIINQPLARQRWPERARAR